jgi:hypothetical protein
MPGKSDEHAFDRLLQDPLIRLLMQSDRVNEVELLQLLRRTRAVLEARRAPREAKILAFPRRREPCEIAPARPGSFLD